MREILFRGFHPDENGTTEITLNGEKIKGKWVEGYFLKAAGMAFISAFAVREPIFVLSETVGEYTSLTDKNGKKIFEWDIIEADGYREVVRFSDGCFYPMGGYVARSGFAYDNNDFEVIENVYEKPLLAKNESYEPCSTCPENNNAEWNEGNCPLRKAGACKGEKE